MGAGAETCRRARNRRSVRGEQPLSTTLSGSLGVIPLYLVLYVVGRLRPGVDAAQAQRELDPVVRQLAREDGLPDADSVSSAVTPLTMFVLGNTRPILFALGGTGIIVLAIACANIIGLLLVRALARERDSALRITLGAPRRRIVSLWLSESALLACAGLLCGLLFSWWGTRALAQLAPASTPQLDRITLTWTGMVFAGIVGLLSAIVCGLVPAWMALRLKLRASLQDGAHGSESKSRRQARHALVVGQLALAMVLLVGAGLMIRSVLVLRHLDLGYAPSEVLTIEVTADTAADALAAKEAPPPRPMGALRPLAGHTWHGSGARKS